MNKELLKELKESGFPFSEHDDDQINKIYGGLGYYATLEELIEGCGEEFGILSMEERGKTNSKDFYWNAESWDSGEEVEGRTPSEAVAKLYIALHKKK